MTSADPADSEGLPEPFILTPEYVEEEAVRGDFVIRWAAVLLAVMLGWTQLTGTGVLLRIRTGQSLAAQGILPPRADTVFSYTVADRPWVNLAWLGDLLLAGLTAVGGFNILSAWCGVVSGLAFWLVGRNSLPGLPTWWGSVCAALATIAAFPLLTPGPTLFTVLGLAAVLYIIRCWNQRPDSARLWWLVPVMVLWTNLDGRAFLGAILIFAYAIGCTLKGGRRGGMGRLWGPCVAAILALMANPFPLDALRSPLQLVRTFYPAMREFGGGTGPEMAQLFRPAFDSALWLEPGWGTLAALALFLVAPITLAMNWRRADWGLVLAWVGTNAWGLASGLDFVAVSVVNAVVATLNGQEWYRQSWKQEYSANFRELFIGRVGRAATVSGMFFIAYWAVSGHMTGAAGRRIGFGLSHDLEADVAGYEQLLGKLGEDEFDDHPFHFTPRQGDLLVWCGRKSFTDSRLGLFAEAGYPNRLAEQRRITESLNSPREALNSTADIEKWAAQWQEPLNAFQITHVVVPLQTNAGYRVWINMASQGMLIDDRVMVRFWRAQRIGGPAAMLYRVDPGVREPAALEAFLKQQPRESVVAQTFQSEKDGAASLRGLFPRGPTFYESTLLLPEPMVSNEVLTARHYAMRVSSGQRSLEETLAYCHQIIRHARRGLAEDPNLTEGYLLLAEAYERLWNAETQMAGRDPSAQAAADRRFNQAIYAAHHADVSRPDDAEVQATLSSLYLQHNDFDLALRHLERIYVLKRHYTTMPMNDPGFSAYHQMGKQLKDTLNLTVERARDLIGQALGSGGAEAAVAVALQQGCPGAALEVLERDLTLVASSVSLSNQYASLLLLSGRTEEGYDQATRLLHALEKARRPAVLPTAARANLAADNEDEAAQLWSEFSEGRAKMLVETGLANLALFSTPLPQIDFAPVYQIMTGYEGLTNWIPDWDQGQWQIAMCGLEQGANGDAKQSLEAILAARPQTPLRPMIAMYLSVLGDAPVPFVEPNSRIDRLHHPQRPPSPAMPEPADENAAEGEAASE